MQFILGTQKVINNILMQGDNFLREVGEAVEKTCVDISNEAKSGHAGNMAHANNRYQNQTVLLTHSITPELAEISYKIVNGIVYATKEYALLVEMKYPYLYPALQDNKDNYKRRLQTALRR